MRTVLRLLLAGALVLGFASCNKEKEGPSEEPVTPVVPAAPVTLKASIASEGGSKATLNDDSGVFSFSVSDPKDVIKVYNGTDVYSSTNVEVSGAEATFTMESGFADEGTGFAAFPAGIVSTISTSGVTFNLPDTYTYAQVGGTDPSAARVPCPMMASFTSGSKLSFKQAGAVLRFRITGCVEGSITFTFTSIVTGSVTLASVPSGDNDGILATNLSDGGYSTTVTGVPEVTSGNYIYITLPVPTGTDPMNVGVWNHGTSVNMVATLSGTAAALSRAEGRKKGVTLKNVKDAAKFNGLTLAGDLYFYYDGPDKIYGIAEDPLEVLKYYSVDYTTSNSEDKGIRKYFFNWNFLNDSDFSFSVDNKNYRVPSSGNAGDWAKIADTTNTYPRNGSVVKSIVARYAYVTVTELDSEVYHTSSIGGVLLFPDKAVIAVPDGAKLKIFNTNDKADNNTLSMSELGDLRDQGCSFFPTAGFWNHSTWYTLFWGQGWYGINEAGSFWSDSPQESGKAYALTILRNHTTNSPRNLIDPKAHDETTNIYYPVRLIRVN